MLNGHRPVYVTLFVVLTSFVSPCFLEAQDYSWNREHAEVRPTGDLKWSPEPFTYEEGDSVRYVDFENGDDQQSGTSREQAWKHHPWDPNATGNAADASGVHTYVFKRGVRYRGALYTEDSGRPDRPIRLTSHPDWGEGEAVLCGSERVSEWKKGADHPDLPEADQVWYTDLDFSPRNVWMLQEDGSVQRIKLARTPNWEISDPHDIKSEWWTWKNPDRPFDNYVTINGKKRHQAFDREHINSNRPVSFYENALLWTTKGWVMGGPFPARVQRVDRENGSLVFPGQWGGGPSYKIIRGCRYYLEDKPHYLDEPGEFWFDRSKTGDGGRLYVRLPNDRSPRSAHVEVARRIHIIESEGIDHLRISGLTFRFTNVHWNLTESPWWVSRASRDVTPACIRLLGSGEDIQIQNCRFEHVHKGVRLKAIGDHDVIDRVVIRDSVFRDTDHGAVDVSEGSRYGDVLPPMGRLHDVRVMRNKFERTGRRPHLFGKGMALNVRYPQTLEVAGNVFRRCYAAGINVLGGKRSGAVTDRPLTRILIHHNKVVDSLLNNDDFGGIETWQGGPAYVYNNISENPVGYRNWDHVLNPGQPNTFAHAYYLDGAFKNYHFNNIARGRENDPEKKLANLSAFQEVHSYENTFFNNTVYNFVKGSRRQAAQAGRNKYLGNVFQDISKSVFRHAKPAEKPKSPNFEHARNEAEAYALHTNAFSGNVFYEITGMFGTLDADGAWLKDLSTFRRFLSSRNALRSDTGTEVERPPLRDAPGHDYRPADVDAVNDTAGKVFVPWGLYGTVAEWHFWTPFDDASVIMDEHWYMTPYHVNREQYHTRPTYPLHLKNVGRPDFRSGPLENWTEGALSFRERDQYAVLKNKRITRPFEYKAPRRKDRWATGKVPEQFTPGEPIEVTIRLTDPSKDQKLSVDLHWNTTEGKHGGFNTTAGPARAIDGEGPYTFTLTPKNKPDLGSFTLVVYRSPSGNWKDHTKVGRVNVAASDDPSDDVKTVHYGGNQVTEQQTASGDDLKNPQIHTSNFLIESYFKLKPDHGERGVLIRKMKRAGYSLNVLKSGRIQFQTAGDSTSYQVVGTESVRDGEWHHVVAEADRTAETLTLYVDGETDAEDSGPGTSVSLANEGDLYVGGTPDGTYLNGIVDFMRISMGTLDDAKTSIDELYAWQFHGPFLRDFTGEPIKGGSRDAGAIDGQ